MRAAANVRSSCRNIGLLLRGLRLAIEEQNFAQSDQQRCNEREPSVRFHECLREYRLLLLSDELYQCPAQRVLRLPVHGISNEMLLACILSNPAAASIIPQADAPAALARIRRVRRSRGLRERRSCAVPRCPTPTKRADELHAGAQLARVEIERCELGLKRDCLRRDHVEIARSALTVLGQR
jgi:hypothetical protein